MKIFGILFTVLLAALVVIGVTMYFQYQNQYVGLKNLYEAQVSTNKAVYDEVWKVIKQQAGVSEKYSADFRKNYTSIMQARNYGGEMMKWIQEANPNFTPELYSKLMNSIEAQRSKFTENQKRMISIRNEIANLVQKFPASIFLGGREIPKLELVTSTQTEAVYNTGKDDSVKLFN